MKRQEKSDDSIVPKSRRKSKASREGTGKGVTASKDAGQLKLFQASAENPKGSSGLPVADRSASGRTKRPLSLSINSKDLPAMTMEEMASVPNLYIAFEQVRANRGSGGPDRQSVEDVEEQIDSVVVRLHDLLLSGNYYPGKIRRVWIPKPGGGKRGLGIPNVIDRIVQQAFLIIMQPHYELAFHNSSHGFRPGRSCHTAVAEAKGYMEDGLRWVVDIDLEKFFDRVNHQRLTARLERRITDKRVMTTIKRMLKARVVLPDGLVESVEEGVPQGGPLSPLLSNIVLDELDRELSRRGHRFVRYADDSNIYVSSERAGLRVMASVSRFIEKKLRLKVNASKSAVAEPNTRHFLGFSLNYDAADGSVTVALSRRTHERIRQRIVELTPRNWGGSIEGCIKRVNSYFNGWMGFFRLCSESEKYFLRTWDAHTRRRLRAIHLKQWKRRRFIYRKLVMLGIKAQAARMVYSRRRKLWALSHSPPVDKALNNKYFVQIGLLSLAKLWDDWNPVKEVREIIASGQLLLFE